MQEAIVKSITPESSPATPVAICNLVPSYFSTSSILRTSIFLKKNKIIFIFYFLRVKGIIIFFSYFIHTFYIINYS